LLLLLLNISCYSWKLSQATSSSSSTCGGFHLEELRMANRKKFVLSDCRSYERQTNG
jgi:hypothetical protein